MIKKNKDLTREEELVQEGLVPAKSTLRELAKDVDLKTLDYLEAIQVFERASEELHQAQIKVNNAKITMKYKGFIFNETKCRYLAKKNGIERDDKSSFVNEMWKAEFSYAK